MQETRQPLLSLASNPDSPKISSTRHEEGKKIIYFVIHTHTHTHTQLKMTFLLSSYFSYKKTYTIVYKHTHTHTHTHTLHKMTFLLFSYFSYKKT